MGIGAVSGFSEAVEHDPRQPSAERSRPRLCENTKHLPEKFANTPVKLNESPESNLRA
jgi:hypothetical protein